MAVQPQGAAGVDVDPLLQTVVAAENALAATWQRLNTLRREAFYGGRYNSAEYDRAVQEYRAAERSLREARDQWGRRRSGQASSAESAPDGGFTRAA